jgi:uncharacterized protein YidB (DUF937 family)
MYGGDPRSAMINAILNMGGNPFKSNPFMQMLLQTAPGLAMTNALSNIGAKPDDIQAMGGPEQMLGNFMQGQIKNGNVFSTLAQAGSNLPGYMNQIRDYQGKVGSMDPTQISPFASMLEGQLSDAQGVGGLLQALYAPGLGGLAKDWMSGVNANLAGTTNRYARDFAENGNMADPPNFFDAVFGRR